MVYEDSGHSPHAPACRLCRERSSTLDLSSPPDTCGSLSTSSQHSRRTPLLGSIPRGLRSSSRGHRPLTLIVPACWCAGSNGGVCAVAFEAFQPPQEGCLFPLRTSSIRAHRKAPSHHVCDRLDPGFEEASLGALCLRSALRWYGMVGVFRWPIFATRWSRVVICTK